MSLADKRRQQRLERREQPVVDQGTVTNPHPCVCCGEPLGRIGEDWAPNAGGQGWHHKCRGKKEVSAHA